MESADDLFKGRHFDREIIILCVRWYLRFKLSFRDLVEMMAERGLFQAHTTIMRWIQHYVPEFEKRRNRFARQAGGSWRVDETYVKIKGRWTYIALSTSKEKQSIFFSAQSGMSRRPKRFSVGRSRARADCRAPSRLTATKPRIGRRGSFSANIGAASGPKSGPRNT
jgi:hypothetical protein